MASKRCTCGCCMTACLWVTFVFMVLALGAFVAAIIWMQTPPAHRMAASMVFSTESFDDPEHDTMHWREVTGFFPFSFQVHDVRWLRAHGQCTDVMNVTQVGGEKRCVSVFVPRIEAKLNPWKIFTEQRMVVNDLRIPYMVVNSDALTEPTETTAVPKDHKHPNEQMRISTVAAPSASTTQPTPPWFTLYGTTKFDHFDIARLRLEDSSTIANLMNEMHRIRRTMPALPAQGEGLFDDVTFYGKSTIMGNGGSWDLTAHIRSLKTGEQRQHLDLKIVGDHMAQTVSFDVSFRTTAIGWDQGPVDGSFQGTGTWRALNMISEPYEALGHGPDGAHPLELRGELSSADVQSNAHLHIDAQRRVRVETLDFNHEMGNVWLAGTLGSMDAYKEWPESVSLRITNTSTPIDQLDADCTKIDCTVRAVAQGGDYRVSVGIRALEKGLRLSLVEPDNWVVAAQDHRCNGICDETEITLQPSDCQAGSHAQFYAFAQNALELRDRDEWCIHVQNPYGVADVVVNSTSRSIQSLTANLHVDNVDQPLFSLESLNVKAQDRTVLVSAEKVSSSFVSVESLHLSGDMVDTHHGSWNMVANGLVYGKAEPVMVMARGAGTYKDSNVDVVSDYGYAKTTRAHVEWGKDGARVAYGMQTGDTSLGLYGVFGKDNHATGHIVIEADATIESFGAIKLADVSHYLVDVADDAHTLFDLVPVWVLEYLPNGTNVVGDMRVKAWGDNGQLPQAVITLRDGTVVIPQHAQIRGTNARITIPDGKYEINGNYQSTTASAEFDSVGWFAWRRGAARFSSDSYYVSDTGTETEFTGDLVWKPGTSPVPEF